MSGTLRPLFAPSLLCLSKKNCTLEHGHKMRPGIVSPRQSRSSILNFNKRVSAAWYLLFLGNHIYGWMGDVIDVLSILTTMLGVCTSLGLGASQLNEGLNRLNPNIEVNSTMKVILIWGVTAGRLFMEFTKANISPLSSSVQFLFTRIFNSVT